MFAGGVTGRCNDMKLSAALTEHGRKTWAVGCGPVMFATDECTRKTQGFGFKSSRLFSFSQWNTMVGLSKNSARTSDETI
jgi:hypothetical protein